MNELEIRIFEKLDSLEALYGYMGIGIGIFVTISGLLIWLYLKKYFESYAKSFFNQSLANHQAKLIDEIGKKFIEQKGNIDREITNLRGEIEKDISHIQSNLQLINNQKSNFLDQKRDSLVEFYSNHDYWLVTIISFNPNKMIMIDLHETSSLYQQKMDEAMIRCQISSGKLDLYVQDNELSQLKSELLNITHELQFNKEAWIVQVRNSWLGFKGGHHLIPGGIDEPRKKANQLRKKENEIYDKLEPIKWELRTKISTILSDILK